MPKTSSRSRDDERDDDRDDRRGGGRGGGRDRDDDRGGGRGGSRYVYKPRSSEEVSRRAKQSSGKYDKWLDTDAPFFKVHDGENQIRIIGWLSGSHPDYDKLTEKYGTHWGIDVMVHNNVGVDNGSYLCLDKAINEPCPICDVYKQDDEDALRPSDRMLCWLIDRASEKSGPMVWSMPLSVSKDISAASQVRGRGAQDGEALMIDDPDEGYDVFFDKEGAKKKTRYTRVAVDKEPSPLHENEKTQNKWLDYVADNCLPDLLKTYEPDYLEKVLSGQSSRKDGDDDDERGSRSRGRDRDDGDSRSSRRGRGRDEADDDKGEDRGRSRGRGREEPEEEENDRGSRRGGRGSAKEDEEEFSRPARGRGRSREEEPADEPEPEETEDRGSERDSGSRGSGTRRGRGRSEPEEETSGKTERYRGKGGAKDEDAGDDVKEAKERLSNVGRRRRR